MYDRDGDQGEANARAITSSKEAAAGDALYLREDFAGAWQRYQEAVRLGPAKPDYHWRLGLAAWKSGRLDETERHFLEAVRLDPRYAPAHSALALWYQAAGRTDRALGHSQAACAADPWDRNVVVTRASVLLAAGQEQEAWELIQPLLVGAAATVNGARGTSATVVARLAVLYASLAPRLARQQVEEAAGKAALEFGGAAGPQAAQPAQQPAQPQPEHQALSLIEWSLRSDRVPPVFKSPLRLASVRLLERAGRYDEAFEQGRLAKEATRPTRPPFNPAAHGEWVSQQIGYFTAERLRCLPRSSVDSSRVVLIVGMPRSGTTLVEQILASHSAVFGAGELSALSDVRRTAERAVSPGPTPYPACLEALSLQEVDALASQYLAALAALPGRDGAPGATPRAAEAAEAAEAAGAGTRRLVTDKMPVNFLILGLAQLVLPGCRVIHCVRSPLDTCVSCYLTDFATTQSFTHDLGHLGAFYRQYRRLMGHWKSVLDLPILDVRYEDLVLDVRCQGKRVLEFLGLPWDERCARFYESRRPVFTASRDQVRRPPYLSSVGRWRHYQKHLAPLIEALGGHVSADPNGDGGRGGSPGSRAVLAIHS